MEYKKLSELCLEIRFDRRDHPSPKFMFISDVHYDNPKCDRALFHSHLDIALNGNYPVICFGDFFCLMQGKYDPRRSKKDVRPEHNYQDYLDRVFSDTAEKLLPYKDVLKVFSDGNHETAILKNCEVDPLNNFTSIMKYKYDTDIFRMGYHGFIKFVSHTDSTNIRSSLVYFHHGKYGGVVTKGVLGVGRHGLVVPDADVIVTGHTHDRWYVEQSRYKLKANGEVVVKPQHHLKCGTYKEEFLEPGGFAIEKVVAPKSMGGWLMEVDHNKSNADHLLHFLPIR